MAPKPQQSTKWWYCAHNCMKYRSTVFILREICCLWLRCVKVIQIEMIYDKEWHATAIPVQSIIRGPFKIYDSFTQIQLLQLANTVLTSQNDICLNTPSSKPLEQSFPDSKVHGDNIGPTWVLLAPGRPDVGPINLVIRVCKTVCQFANMTCRRIRSKYTDTKLP